MSSPDDSLRIAFFEHLLRLADDRLVLGHRLSEWCGHAPILEEDIALANIALDLIGQATLLLTLAGEVEGKGRDADALAFLRTDREYRNALMLELPRGDFAVTIVRQFLFSAYSVAYLRALQSSSHASLAGIAAKAFKETRYHARHSGEWVIKLGDGTAESHARAQRAIDELWRFTGELFHADGLDEQVFAAGLSADPRPLEAAWRSQVEDVFARATLDIPSVGYMQRTFPGARW